MHDQVGWFFEEWPGERAGVGWRITATLHEEQSPIQKISIYQTESFGRLMALDGCVMVTDRDNFFYHEMMTHSAVCSHPAPRDVLIIGGGDCGSLHEVLRHTEIHSVTQVEIDERVTRVSEQYFPELCARNHDPRAKLLFDDGIAYLRNAAPGSLDIIIVDGSDPVGPAEGLFNQAFFDSAFRALRPGGIIIGQTESPLLHGELIRDVRAAMERAGFAPAETLCYPQPCYPSGWWSATMALKAPYDAGLAAAPRALPFATKYWTPAMHMAARTLPPFLAKLFA